MRFCSLASCSRFGNSYLVDGARGTRILVDCGSRIRRLEAALAARAVDPHTVSGIFMTHDHMDHVAALLTRRPFAVKYGIPVWATPGFWRGWDRAGRWLPRELRRCLSPGGEVDLGEFSLRAFAKPHDAVEPVSYLVRDAAGCRLAVVTDLGHVPGGYYGLLADCEFYVFEANHDRGMELSSGRGWPLIKRVLGEMGHLSNDQCGEALARLVGPRTRAVLLAHLSLDCNRPDLAVATVGRHLQATGWNGELLVAPRGEPSEWIASPATRQHHLRWTDLGTGMHRQQLSDSSS